MAAEEDPRQTEGKQTYVLAGEEKGSRTLDCCPLVPHHLLACLLCFQNVTANHRSNDVIVTEGSPQCLVGRFMYGPLDMVALTGEKVTVRALALPVEAP